MSVRMVTGGSRRERGYGERTEQVKGLGEGLSVARVEIAMWSEGVGG